MEQAALGAGDARPPSAPFLGMQTGAQQTRVVPGRVSDAEWGKMVAVLRRQLGGTGEVESIGDVRAWRRHPYEVTVEPEGGGTRLTATANWRGDTMGAVGLTTLLLGFALLTGVMGVVGGKSDVLFITAMFAAMGTAMGLWAWPNLWAKGPRIDAKLSGTMDALAALATSGEGAARAPSSESDRGRGGALSENESSGARVDPALLDADAPERPALSGGRGRRADRA